MGNKDEQNGNINLSDLGDLLTKGLGELNPTVNKLNGMMGGLNDLKKMVIESQELNGKILLKETIAEGSGNKILTDKHKVILEFSSKEEADKYYNSIK